MPIFFLLFACFNHVSSSFVHVVRGRNSAETKRKHVFARWMHFFYVWGPRYISLSETNVRPDFFWVLKKTLRGLPGNRRHVSIRESLLPHVWYIYLQFGVDFYGKLVGPVIPDLMDGFILLYLYNSKCCIFLLRHFGFFGFVSSSFSNSTLA